LHLPQDPVAFLEPLIERAKAGVLAVSKTAAEGILRVDDELHLTPLEPLADDPKVTKLRAALDRRVGEAQLPELVLAVDAEVRFSWIMLGREQMLPPLTRARLAELAAAFPDARKDHSDGKYRNDAGAASGA
jgi:hypothetical protein